MSGKLCDGSSHNSRVEVRETKSYAEGALHRAQGTAIAYPVTDNPHQASSPASVAWIAGWDVAEAAAPGDLAQTGCLAPINGILA